MGTEGGFFLTFEGVEGSGKSTQQALLARRLRGAGHGVRELREPGYTELGERLRPLLLRSGGTPPAPAAELFLYLAARAQLAAEVIAPALARGQVVICDRFVDSTTAYQGYGRGFDLALIERLNRTATGGVWPDVTVLLDLDPAVGLARRAARREGLDRFEQEALAFHQRVREGYRALARAEPDRFVVLDGGQDPAALAAEVWARVAPRLPAPAPLAPAP